MRSVQVDTLKIDDKIFSIQTGKGSEWLCLKRQVKKLSHHKCCFGINHQCYLTDHQLYMLDVILEVNKDKELASNVEEINGKH